MSKLHGLVLAATLVTAATSAGAQASAVLGPGINAPNFTLKAERGAVWPKELTGTWKAKADSAQGTAGGTLVLARDKTVKLQPEGMYELRGYWFVKEGTLVFDTPLQRATAVYSLTQGKQLSLKFPNGVQQQFEKVTK